MKYETIGGDVKDTESGKCTVKDLKIGDRFKFKSSDDIWEPLDQNCKWSGSAGSSTRLCHNITKKFLLAKLCRTEVIKL